MTVEVLTPSSREEWLGVRSRTIGGSEVAALFGVHPFMTTYSLWAEKAGKISQLTEETPPMRRGRHLESVAVKILREERPHWQVTANPVPGGKFYRDLGLGISCTPDAFATDPDREGFGIVQIKSVEPSVFRSRWRAEDGEVEPPLYVAVQAIQEAYLTGASWAVVAPLVIGFGIDMPLLEVPLHVGLIESIKARASDFWGLVESGQAPDPDYGRDGEVIAKLFNADQGTEIDLSHDNHLPILIDEREILKAEIKERQVRCAEIETEFKAKIGDHAVAHLANGRRVTWKTQHQRGYSVEPSSFRVLRFSKAK